MCRTWRDEFLFPGRKRYTKFYYAYFDWCTNGVSGGKSDCIKTADGRITSGKNSVNFRPVLELRAFLHFLASDRNDVKWFASGCAPRQQYAPCHHYLSLITIPAVAVTHARRTYVGLCPTFLLYTIIKAYKYISLFIGFAIIMSLIDMYALNSFSRSFLRYMMTLLLITSCNLRHESYFLQIWNCREKYYETK